MQHDTHWLSRLGCSDGWLSSHHWQQPVKLEDGERDERKYERDCEELTLREVLRAHGRDLVRIGIGVAICLLIEIALLLTVGAARADDWSAPDMPCIPTVSDYDHAYKIEGAAFAIVWWCDEEDGIYTRWFTGTAPGAVTPESQAAALLSLAGRDPFAFLKTAYKRASSPSEMELVMQVEVDRSPRCYVTGTAATTQVLTSTAQYAVGPAKVDGAGVSIRAAVGTPIACIDRLPKETTKRYCNALGVTDTKGRRIEGDAWLPCRIERAPEGGWAQ